MCVCVFANIFVLCFLNGVNFSPKTQFGNQLFWRFFGWGKCSEFRNGVHPCFSFHRRLIVRYWDHFVVACTVHLCVCVCAVLCALTFNRGTLPLIVPEPNKSLIFGHYIKRPQRILNSYLPLRITCKFFIWPSANDVA